MAAGATASSSAVSASRSGRAKFIGAGGGLHAARPGSSSGSAKISRSRAS
jgi:hypothetical protein